MKVLLSLAVLCGLLALARSGEMHSASEVNVKVGDAVVKNTPEERHQGEEKVVVKRDASVDDDELWISDHDDVANEDSGVHVLDKRELRELIRDALKMKMDTKGRRKISDAKRMKQADEEVVDELLSDLLDDRTWMTKRSMKKWAPAPGMELDATEGMRDPQRWGYGRWGGWGGFGGYPGWGWGGGFGYYRPWWRRW